MLQDNILYYYGLSESDGITFQSYLGEYAIPFRNELVNMEQLKTQQNHSIVLIFSYKAKTILERKLHPALFLERRFGLCCNLLLERQIASLEGVARICALEVPHDYFPVLLRVLYDNSNRSFAIISNTRESSEYYCRIIYLLGQGLLTPKVLKACTNATLNNNSSFLHILRGSDGYSANFFSKR